MNTDKVPFALSLSGKYLKRVLTGMEEYLETKDLDPVIRKLIIDGFKDMEREQAKVLGVEVKR